MAPEQLAGAAGDHRADIHAFGLLAHELLTGRLPSRGEPDAPGPPGCHRPALPAALAALVSRALEEDPASRQQSMAEVAEELSGALADLGLPPVYGHAPRPEIALGSVRGFTDRFEVRALAHRRSCPGRGAAEARADPVCLAPAGAGPASGAATTWRMVPRRRVRAAALLAASAVVAISAVGLVAWRELTAAARSRGPALAAREGARASPDVAGEAAAGVPGAAATVAETARDAAGARARPPVRASAAETGARSAPGRSRHPEGATTKAVDRRPAASRRPSRMEELKPDPF
jgi:hypothetical protein